jgi:hypothetical protein
MRWLKQSTAVDIAIGPFLDATDGITAETALTISQADVRLKKNNGAWAQVNDDTAATHEENGWYEKELNTTDTDTLGVLIIAVTEAGAVPVWHEFMVVPANVWDSLFGADKLQVHADEITAGLITATAIATGAIDADALATDAVSEIAAGVTGVQVISAGYVGDFDPGDVIDLYFETKSGATPTALAGSPAISIYKDNSTSEDADGVTVTASFDSRTGLNHVQIDTAADGTFYSGGSTFVAVITTGTVSGVTAVPAVAGVFSLRARSALMPTVPKRIAAVATTGHMAPDWGMSPIQAPSWRWLGRRSRRRRTWRSTRRTSRAGCLRRWWRA